MVDRQSNSSTQVPQLPKKAIFRTGNIMSSGYSAGFLRKKPNLENSCYELINSLKEQLRVLRGVLGEEEQQEQEARREKDDNGIRKDGQDVTGQGSIKNRNVKLFKVDEDILYAPGSLPEDRIGKNGFGLKDNQEDYDITVKLFYLPNVLQSVRPRHTEEAISLVLKTLGTTSINLLIVSFPDIHFDADDETDDDDDKASPSPTATTTTTSTTPSTNEGTKSNVDDEILSILPTYRTLESLTTRKVISKIGLSEFGTRRLSSLLPHALIKPSVDQINVRDCCVVPKQLIMYAKNEGINLLTHNDCADILPRELLQEVVDGFGLFTDWEEDAKGDASDNGLMKRRRYEVLPQWVVKYTAVVRDRGVVENKGYIAMAEIQ